MANIEKLKELFGNRETAKAAKRKAYDQLRRKEITPEQYKWYGVEEHEAHMALKYFLGDDGWWDFLVIKTEALDKFLKQPR